jgi:hypothetical protein
VIGNDTQLWEQLYIYHVIKQCTEKETTSLSDFSFTIKLSYLHDLFNTTFKNISVTTFVAGIGVPREIHRPVASH